MSKSLITLAYEKLEKVSEPMKFKELFDACLAESGLELSEGEYKKTLARFYTQLSVDGRFACFSDNTWDLRAHHKYVYNDIVIEEEVQNDDEEERRMEKQEVGTDSVLLDEDIDEEKLEEDDESLDEEKEEVSPEESEEE